MSFTAKKRRTRREKFLAEMDQVVPWVQLVAMIEPYYPKSGRRARPPIPLEAMLQIYFMQQWYALSDPGVEDALYEIESMRRFAGLALIDDALPDETTILKFRRLLGRHGLSAQMMNAINAVSGEQRAMLKGGTLVDATIVHAPAPTKNQPRRRDPEMRQTKKGNQWYFGMKVHIGADVHSGLAHTVSVIPAHASDISQLPRLLRADDRAVFSERGYANNAFKRAARRAGVYWGVAMKATSQHPLTAANKRTNRKHSAIRTRVEPVFRVIKHQLGNTKLRYRGLEKNAAQVFTVITLTNLYLARRRLMPG